MEYSEYLKLREEVLAWVEPRIKPARFTHTLGVEQLAVTLARIYSPEDYMSASLAALLHDNAKNLPLDVQQYLCNQHYPEMELRREHSAVFHAFAGAAEARRVFPQASEDIINAIAYHTTGRPGMSVLEKIIYCADYAEANRDPFPELLEVRKVLRQDLDEGLRMILSGTGSYVRAKGKVVFPLTEETLQYYEKEKFSSKEETAQST
ncbi:MAG: HD domain-containing protein [Lachnospiraceae bacterium]|nr:HD domain-containing protein [Lachnospiraceae bacterium]